MKKSKSKIAFIHIFNSYTGSPMMLAQFIRCLNYDQMNLQPVIITNRTPGAISELDAEYRHINYQFKPNRRWVTLVIWLWAQVQIFFQLIRLAPAIVIINTIHPFGAMVYAYLFRKRHAIYVHEHDFGNKYITEFLFFLVNKAKNKIVVSNALKKHRRELNDAVYIPNSHSIQRAVRETMKVKKLGLVTMGDFKKKGVYAFLEVAKRFPNLEFILQTGLDKETLSDLLSKIDVPSNVIPRTSTRDMQSFYGEIDLMLNLSNPKYWVETFGLTIIEAQASGIPVIAPHVGGPAEIVNNDVDGYLVDPLDIDQIEKIILRLQTDEQHYRELCANAYLNGQRYNQTAYCQKVNQFMTTI